MTVSAYTSSPDDITTSTYAPALDSAGLTLASVEYDGPYNYADGTPVNNWYTGYKNINCSVEFWNTVRAQYKFRR